VQAQYSFIRCCLEELGARAVEIRTLLKNADERTMSARADQMPLRTKITAVGGDAPVENHPRVTIKGFVERVENGRSVPTQETTEYSVRHFNRFEAVTALERPLGYVLSPKCPPEVIERLRLHGISYEVLAEPRTYKMSKWKITGAEPASRQFQNRVLVRIEADLVPGEPAPAEAGSIVVTTGQPLGNLVVLMLEPLSEDGLATWGFFDAFLKPDGGDYPVRRVER
jgi:hypothetical protein